MSSNSASAVSNNELDNLFFGSTKVFLASVAGRVESFPPKHGWKSPPLYGSGQEWDTAVSEAAALSQPLGALGDEYSTMVQPGIVAVSCVPNKEPPERKHKKDESDSTPKIPLPSALLKHPASTAPASCLIGVASGVRSAIVKHEGRWLRLKGCGNYDEGFPVKEMGTLPSGEPSLNVRGSCFESTVNREACMTAHVASLLEPHGVPIGNKSVGVFHYEAPKDREKESWPAWPYPLVSRHCGVFETVGDRRAGDHLIGGLEKLIHLLLPMEQSALDTFTRQLNELRGLPSDTEGLFTTDMLPYLMEPAPPPAVCMHTPLPQAAPPPSSEFSVAPEYASLWDREVIELTSYFDQADASASNLVMSMAWRIGWECGRVQHILIQGEVSWGTFPDSMGTHCNAHANNMVVLPFELATSNQCLLAPVDLDLSFHRSAYIQELAAQYKGFDSDWSDLMGLERQGFYATLAGSDFASTGVGNTANSLDPRRIALRDTICAGFNVGVEGGIDEHVSTTVGDEARSRACASLVRLALISTVSVET